MVQRKEVVVAGKVFDLGEYLPEQPNWNPGQTVSWGLSEYRDIAKGLGKSPRTLEWFDLSTRQFIKIIGDIPIDSVTPLVMVHFAAGLKERPRWEGHPFAKAGGEISETTARNYCKGIKTMFSVLARVGAIPENPLATYHPPTAPEKLPTTWKADQVRKIIDQTKPSRSAEQQRDRAILALFYDSGCRVSELCHLETDNLSLEDGNFIVPGKPGRQLIYWFEKGAAWELQRYLEVRPQNGASNVFLTFDGRPLTRRRVYEIVHKYAEKAGLKGERLSPHTLRHSCGREIQRSNGNIEITRKKLNHRDIKSTMIYARLEDEDVKRAGVSPFNALGLPRGRRPEVELPRDIRRFIETMERALRT